ncbi:G- coupled receptor Mth2, partial [Brachionus plicatilis]
MNIFYLLFFNFQIVFACDDFCFNKTLPRYQNCFCSECDLFDDCCSDVTPKTTTTLHNYECNSELKNYGTIYTIGKCPDNYQIKKLMLKCVLEPSTIIQSIPVYSYETNKFFKNIFCALCNLNSEKINDLKFFSLETNMKYNVSILEHIIKKPWHGFEVSKPDGVPWPRKCIKHIDTCPNNFNNSEIISLCSNYTAYRFSIFGKLYKNEYCAKCNEPETFLLCSKIESGLADYMSLQILFDLRNLKNE